jgi:hypothetical protein
MMNTDKIIITFLSSVSYGRLLEVQKDLAVLMDVFTHDIMGELTLDNVDRQVHSTASQGHFQFNMYPSTNEVTHDITLHKPYIS